MSDFPGSETRRRDVRAAVITCSTRAAQGVYDDVTGPMIDAWLRERGFAVEARVVADGPPVGQALGAALADGCRVVITTGGTGVSPTDATPEQTRDLIVQDLPGVAEALRAAGVANGVPTAVLSRGLAGVADGAAGRAFVVNLPGSRGGVKDGLSVLDGILDHVLDQLDGGTH